MPIKTQMPEYRLRAVRERPTTKQDELLAAVNYVERRFLRILDFLCAIDAAVRNGEITVDEMVAVWKHELTEGLD